jgi:hypothetical protein
MVSTVLLSCPISNKTAKGRASGIIRLPATDGDVESGALNLMLGKKAARNKAEFEIVSARDRKADDVTASRVVPAVVNWNLTRTTT